MNKKKKRTTRAAKLSGILVGFGAWTLIILISLTIAIFFLKVFGVRILENDVSIIIFTVLWFLLGPITAITFGRFVTFRWAGYPNKKKVSYQYNIFIVCFGGAYFISRKS